MQYYDETDMLDALDDGVQVYEGLCQMDTQIFHHSKICRDEDDPYQAYKNYQEAIKGLKKFYRNLHQDVNDAEDTIESLQTKLNTMKVDIEQTSIRSINQAAFVNIETLLDVLELALGVAVNCENTETIISSFTDKLDEQTLDDLMSITQDVLQKYGKKEGEDETFTDTNQVE